MQLQICSVVWSTRSFTQSHHLWSISFILRIQLPLWTHVPYSTLENVCEGHLQNADILRSMLFILRMHLPMCFVVPSCRPFPQILNLWLISLIFHRTMRSNVHISKRIIFQCYDRKKMADYFGWKSQVWLHFSIKLVDGFKIMSISELIGYMSELIKNEIFFRVNYLFLLWVSIVVFCHFVLTHTMSISWPCLWTWGVYAWYLFTLSYNFLVMWH